MPEVNTDDDEGGEDDDGEGADRLDSDAPSDMRSSKEDISTSESREEKANATKNQVQKMHKTIFFF